MTNLQVDIYEFLIEQSEYGEWTSQKELLRHLHNIGYDICERKMRLEITNIRKNDEIEKIIVSNTKRGYKILSYEEELKYIEAQKYLALAKLSQYWKDVRRFNRNNQAKINIDTKEQEFVESVLKEKVA